MIRQFVLVWANGAKEDFELLTTAYSYFWMSVPSTF